MIWVTIIGLTILYFIVVAVLIACINFQCDKSTGYNYDMDDVRMFSIMLAIFWIFTAIPVLLYYCVFKKIHNKVVAILERDKNEHRKNT